MSVDWQARYVAPSKSNWQGRTDGRAKERFHQIIEGIDLRADKPMPEHKNAYAIIGFSSDEGVRRNYGRSGSTKGPQAIRNSAASLPLHTTRDLHIYDVGDITCADGNLEEAQICLGHLVSKLLKDKLFPIVLGGSHDLAWGHYLGIAETKPPKLGIINFDAHFDLRPLLDGNRGSSGTPFLQIAQAQQAASSNFSYLTVGIQRTANTPSLYRQAEQLNTQIIHADEIHELGPQNFMRQIDKFIAQHTHIYLTLCLDVFAAACAPGVSAPQALGLYPRQVLVLLKHIVRCDKVISFDIAELTPQFDEHMLTQQLAASMLAEYIQNHAFPLK